MAIKRKSKVKINWPLVVAAIGLLFGTNLVLQFTGHPIGELLQQISRKDPSVGISYPVENHSVDVRYKDTIDNNQNTRATFVASGSSANVPLNSDLQTYVVGTDEYKKEWIVYDTFGGGDGNWDSNITAGYVFEKKPYYLMAVVTDRKYVDALGPPDNRKTITNPDELHPIAKSKIVFFTVGKIIR